MEQNQNNSYITSQMNNLPILFAFSLSPRLSHSPSLFPFLPELQSFECVQIEIETERENKHVQW